MKVLAKFSRNRQFGRKPPGKRVKIFFSPILQLFLKIYPYLDSFDQFKALEVISVLNYVQTLISLDPQIWPILGPKMPKKGKTLDF